MLWKLERTLLVCFGKYCELKINKVSQYHLDFHQGWQEDSQLLYSNRWVQHYQLPNLNKTPHGHCWQQIWPALPARWRKRLLSDPEISSAINWDQNRRDQQAALCHKSTHKCFPWSWHRWGMEAEGGRAGMRQSSAPQFCRDLHRGCQLTGGLHTASGSSSGVRAPRIC